MIANRHDTNRLDEREERQTAHEARRGEAIDEARVPSACRGARLRHHRVEVTGMHVPKHPDTAGGVDGCAKVVQWTHVRGILACSECTSLPMLPPVASVLSPSTHQPVPQHLGNVMAHGRTGGWLLVAETISAGQTMRPPEIIIDIKSEEIRPYQPKHSPSSNNMCIGPIHLLAIVVFFFTPRYMRMYDIFIRL